MTTRIYVDRSRYETGQRCARARWLEYHQDGTGVTSARKPLPLAVGGAVHVGLAKLLEGSQANPHGLPLPLDKMEEGAVAAALADFSAFQSALDLGDELSLPPEFERSEIDEYTFREQSALVEGMIRAYARRRLRPLLEQFEVLEVEREGEWELAKWKQDEDCLQVLCKTCGYRSGPFEDSGERSYRPISCPKCNHTAEYYSATTQRELWFMSRPDALLRERESNALYLLSFKTAASWDVRKARDAEHDMQGMSEGVEIERRLAALWDATHGGSETATYKLPQDQRVLDYVRALDAPPRILAVRYEYLIKGERWRDKDLSERFGVEMRSQKSHLVRRYIAVSVPAKGTAGYSIGDTCWSWDYTREDGRDGNLAWQNWKARAVWETADVKGWIDSLDSAAETMSGEDSTMGLEPRLLGYKCDAQAVGVTRSHPLDQIFIPPITVYRNEDELRDLVDQMEAGERRIAEGVAAVNAAADEGDRRHELNVHFPQSRRACSYPTTCQFVRVCYGGEDIKRDPCASGLYKIRVPNHIQELRDDSKSHKS